MWGQPSPKELVFYSWLKRLCCLLTFMRENLWIVLLSSPNDHLILTTEGLSSLRDLCCWSGFRFYILSLWLHNLASLWFVQRTSPYSSSLVLHSYHQKNLWFNISITWQDRSCLQNLNWPAFLNLNSQFINLLTNKHLVLCNKTWSLCSWLYISFTWTGSGSTMGMFFFWFLFLKPMTVSALQTLT